MTNVKGKLKERTIVEQEEFNKLLRKADKITNEYYRLRAKCLLVFLYKSGNRVSEIARLLVENIVVNSEKNKLSFKIFLDKKRIRRKLEGEFTEEGKQKYKSEKKIQSARKALSLSEGYTQHIIDYLDYMKEHFPESTYLFPSAFHVFGQTVLVKNQKHLSRVQVWRILKKISPKIWCHLFRETLGGKIAEREGHSLESMFKIKRALNLVRVETAYRYVERYAEYEIAPEDEELL